MILHWRRRKKKRPEPWLNATSSSLIFSPTKLKASLFALHLTEAVFIHLVPKRNRKRFDQSVPEHLEETGLWLTLVGNADEDRKGPDPPQRTAGDIVLAVEPYFEVLSPISTQFGSNQPNPPRAWRGLMKKRHAI